MLENILLWFLLGYMGWKILAWLCPIRAKVVVRFNPMQNDEALLKSVLSSELLPKVELEKLFKMRFVQISTAFASGQIKAIRSLVTDTVYHAFEQAVQSRTEKGQVVDYKLVSFKKSDLANPDNQNMYWVDFETEQINLLKDEKNNVIEGDPMYLSLVREKWQFVWDEKSASWLLSAVQNVEAHAA